MTLDLRIDEGSGPAVVLLHGFPELPNSWAAQVGPLVDDGFRVLVPCLRGYGGSPAPPDPAAYTADLLAADVMELLDTAGVARAAVVGHDWGAQLAWWITQLHPERVGAVAALSVPFTGRPPAPPLATLCERAGDRFFYMCWFSRPGDAEAEFEADPRDLILGLYHTYSGAAPAKGRAAYPRAGTRLGDTLEIPAELPGWLPAGDLDEMVETFTATGWTGPLNFYRAMDITWEHVPQLGTRGIECPALFVAGEADPVLAFTPPTYMTGHIRDLQTHLLPGVGHWVQREAAAEVTRLLAQFLGRHRGAFA